jgi:fatty acyl-CoA reductase
MATAVDDESGNGSSIADFYAGRSIFITGATGFMGKVLVEKLLRSCPGVKCLYLLMRPTATKDIECRRLELVNNPVSHLFTFDLLKNTEDDSLRQKASKWVKTIFP